MKLSVLSALLATVYCINVDQAEKNPHLMATYILDEAYAQIEKTTVDGRRSEHDTNTDYVKELDKELLVLNQERAHVLNSESIATGLMGTGDYSKLNQVPYSQEAVDKAVKDLQAKDQKIKDEWKKTSKAEDQAKKKLKETEGHAKEAKAIADKIKADAEAKAAIEAKLQAEKDAAKIDAEAKVAQEKAAKERAAQIAAEKVKFEKAAAEAKAKEEARLKAEPPKRALLDLGSTFAFASVHPGGWNNPSLNGRLGWHNARG